ncbi:LTA synthase family protein [Lysinibacillus agricola]
MKKDRIFTNLTILLSPFLFTVLIEFIHRGSIEQLFSWISSNLHLFLYTTLMIFAFTNILIIVIRSKRIIYIVGLLIGLLLSLLAYISNVKSNLRGEPLSILDYRLITEAITIADEFKFNLIVPIILIVIFSVIITIIFKNVKGKIDNLEAIVFSGISIVILITTFMLDIDDFSDFNIEIPADTSFNHEENGFVLASVIDVKFLLVPKPDNYSKESIAEIVDEMSEYSDKLAKNASTKFIEPNIIFVMSESFSDPSSLNVKANKEVIPNFINLTNEYTSGTITVPGIGGGTANTEFEVLTGFSKNNIPNYSTPYNPYNTYIYDNVDSLATEFSKNKYETLALHSYHSWFYRRNNVYKYLGFNQFKSLEFMEQKDYFGRFLDDKIINETIIDQVNKTPNKDFIFAVTMASHGPYDIEHEKNIIVEDKVDNRQELENYLNAIHLSDKYLGELISYFKDYDEPTVIVFFGDHIPPLGNEIYNSLGIEMGSEISKKAPFVIWSNYYKGLNKNTSIDASLLGALVLQEVGYRNNDFFNYLTQSLHENNSDNSDFKENIYNLQYDMLHGNRYFYSINEEFENKDYTLGTNFESIGINAKQFKESTALEITGVDFVPTLMLAMDNKFFPIQYSDSRKVYSYIPTSYLDKDVNIELVVKDSRDTVIKKSNKIKGSKAHIISKEEEFENWVSVNLNEEQYWEIFDIKEEFVIVRLKLDDHELNDERPYFIEKDGLILEDKNADSIEDSLYSDIYANGYMYISIPRDARLANVDIENIKNYFAQENYILNILK